MMDNDVLVFVGTYTHGRSKGIYLCRLDTATGALSPPGEAAEMDNPSFLAVDPARRRLFAAVERRPGKPDGAVCAFAFDSATGKLTLLNEQSSHGSSPCYLSVDKTGRFVLAANYGSGSVCVLPVRKDGQLGEAVQVLQHEGRSAHPTRQAGPHAHSVTLDPSNRYAFAADLGMDKVMIYRFYPAEGKLKPNEPPWAEVEAGSGPRHLAFHPTRRYAYLINELSNTMTAFAYDGKRGALSELQTVSTLPAGFGGASTCADVHAHPSGRFIYGSNRGHDSIAIFAVDEKTGRLAALGHEPTGGRTPRGFAMDAAGAFLLAANQDSDTIVTFRIDPHTGLLERTGHAVEVPSPVCVKIAAAPRR
jgi:6-phosphogluconolactonase